MQSGIKKFGDDGKESAMKEIRNIAIKNNWFGKLEHEQMTEEQKKKALPLLMFMTMKHNGQIKSRGVANGSNQRTCTDKNAVSSPTPDLCSLKNACDVAAKERRDLGSVDLPGFFLQTEANEEDRLITIKTTGAVTLLLVGCDPCT